MPTEAPDSAANALTVLSDADRQELKTCGRTIVFHAGQEILHQGQHNASLFVVERGGLHAQRETGSRRVFLGLLEAGSVFGEISMFDPGPTTASVSATSDGELLEIDSEHFRRFAELRPAAALQFLQALLQQMARRLRRTDDRLIDAIVWGGLRK